MRAFLAVLSVLAMVFLIVMSCGAFMDLMNPFGHSKPLIVALWAAIFICTVGIVHVAWFRDRMAA